MFSLPNPSLTLSLSLFLLLFSVRHSVRPLALGTQTQTPPRKEKKKYPTCSHSILEECWQRGGGRAVSGFHHSLPSLPPPPPFSLFILEAFPFPETVCRNTCEGLNSLHCFHTPLPLLDCGAVSERTGEWASKCSLLIVIPAVAKRWWQVEPRVINEEKSPRSEKHEHSGGLPVWVDRFELMCCVYSMGFANRILF